ncbi:MAG: hypothetical protein WCI26_05385 [Acidimicrobiales bacterium]
MIDALEAPGAVESDIATQDRGDVASSELTVEQQSKRRFTIATILGTAVVAPIYLWVLWDLWTGKINALRSVAPNNFYELQARAMFSGHLNVPTGSLGIEGFLHGGKTFTYFGIWPSIIRMPVLPFTHAYDGALTAPSMLIAWFLTALFTALLIWRIRILVRGSASLGWAEAASYGALTAAILGGSVVLYIAANPSTYDEDFAWSIALVVASMFTLLGMAAHPSARGAWASGLLIVAANLNRSPTGYACVITAFLLAGWFALGKGGKDQRRWAFWLVLVGVIPLLANCAVTYAKFGMPFGLPMAEQEWAHINAHRRHFLEANGGKAFSFGFIPSTAWAYLNPTALRFSSVFPFIGAPLTPAHAITPVVLDQTYSTTSVTDASPLLFLLSCWGLVTAFRPKGIGDIRFVRLMLIGSAIATGGVLVWGYISYRYVSDLMPFFIIAGAVGMVDIWRRLDGRSSRARKWTFGGIAALAAFGVLVNSAITASPSTWFSKTQLAGFVNQQDSLTPGALSHTVVTGTRLPYYAPAGTLFIAGQCDGLYRSTGDSYANSPGQQIAHATWAPVQQSGALTHVIDMHFNVDHWKGPAVTLLTYGDATLLLRPAPGNKALVEVRHASPTPLAWPSSVGFAFPQVLHGIYRITVTTDPYLKSIVVGWYGSTMINRYLAGTGPAVVAATPPTDAAALPAITVTEGALPPTHMALCKSLLRAQTPST